MYTHVLMSQLGMLSHALVIAGVVLLTYWAMKNVSKTNLKMVSLWLIGAGIVIGLIAAGGGYGGKYGMKMKMMEGAMMEEGADQ